MPAQSEASSRLSPSRDSMTPPILLSSTCRNTSVWSVFLIFLSIFSAGVLGLTSRRCFAPSPLAARRCDGLQLAPAKCRAQSDEETSKGHNINTDTDIDANPGTRIDLLPRHADKVTGWRRCRGRTSAAATSGGGRGEGTRAEAGNIWPSSHARRGRGVQISDDKAQDDNGKVSVVVAIKSKFRSLALHLGPMTTTCAS